jgi:hypothetical protein
VILPTDSVLRNERDYAQDDLPTQMAYKKYTSFAASHGVQLIGWPEIDTQGNPVMDTSKFKTNGQWQRLLNALDSGVCRWAVMSEEEVTQMNARVRQEAANAAPKKAGAATKKTRVVKSKEIIEDSDEE